VARNERHSKVVQRNKTAMVSTCLKKGDGDDLLNKCVVYTQIIHVLTRMICT